MCQIVKRNKEEEEQRNRTKKTKSKRGNESIWKLGFVEMRKGEMKRRGIRCPSHESDGLHGPII